jgi:hypothetical protein
MAEREAVSPERSRAKQAMRKCDEMVYLSFAHIRGGHCHAVNTCKRCLIQGFNLGILDAGDIWKGNPKRPQAPETILRGDRRHLRPSTPKRQCL